MTASDNAYKSRKYKHKYNYLIKQLIGGGINNLLLDDISESTVLEVQKMNPFNIYHSDFKNIIRNANIDTLKLLKKKQFTVTEKLTFPTGTHDTIREYQNYFCFLIDDLLPIDYQNRELPYKSKFNIKLVTNLIMLMDTDVDKLNNYMISCIDAKKIDIDKSKLAGFNIFHLLSLSLNTLIDDSSENKLKYFKKYYRDIDEILLQLSPDLLNEKFNGQTPYQILTSSSKTSTITDSIELDDDLCLLISELLIKYINTLYQISKSKLSDSIDFGDDDKIIKNIIFSKIANTNKYTNNGKIILHITIPLLDIFNISNSYNLLNLAINRKLPNDIIRHLLLERVGVIERSKQFDKLVTNIIKKFNNQNWTNYLNHIQKYGLHIPESNPENQQIVTNLIRKIYSDEINSSDLDINISKISDSVFLNKIKTIIPSDKMKVTGSWIYFQTNYVVDPKLLWKVFINPLPVYFLQVLWLIFSLVKDGKFPYSFKIFTSPMSIRKSDRGIWAESSKDPKFVIYLAGSDLITCIRCINTVIPAKLATKYGFDDHPSFTKKYNNLISYGQGGFTELGPDGLPSSSREQITKTYQNEDSRQSKLKQFYEGEGFYKYKGSIDSLIDSKTTRDITDVLSMDDDITFKGCFEKLLFTHNTNLVIFGKILTESNPSLKSSPPRGLQFRYGLDSQYGEIKFIMHDNFWQDCQKSIFDSNVYNFPSATRISKTGAICNDVVNIADIEEDLKHDALIYDYRHRVMISIDRGDECMPNSLLSKPSWCNYQLHLNCERELNKYVYKIIVPHFVKNLEYNGKTFSSLIETNKLNDKIVYSNIDMNQNDYYDYQDKDIYKEFSVYQVDKHSRDIAIKNRTSSTSAKSSKISASKLAFLNEEFLYLKMLIDYFKIKQC